MPDKSDILEKIIKPIVQEAGVELFDLTLKPYRGTVNVELLVDLPDGGISIDQCAQINRTVHMRIEEENLYGDDYTVSVASPGLDWPLKTERDFRRLIGYNFDITCQGDDQDQRTKQNGVLKSVDAKCVVLTTLDGEVDILLKHIDKAVVLI